MATLVAMATVHEKFQMKFPIKVLGFEKSLEVGLGEGRGVGFHCLYKTRS